jgi:kinesin family protein 18/19
MFSKVENKNNVSQLKDDESTNSKFTSKTNVKNSITNSSVNRLGDNNNKKNFVEKKERSKSTKNAPSVGGPKKVTFGDVRTNQNTNRNSSNQVDTIVKLPILKSNSNISSNKPNSINSTNNINNNTSKNTNTNNNNNNNNSKTTNKIQDNTKDPYSEESLILNKFNKGNMLVAVRKRPLNKKESEYNSVDLVRVVGEDQVSVMDMNYASNPDHGRTSIPKNQHFFFDYAFDENTTQEEVYKKTTKFLLQSVIDGYNATVLAYGATGCGKTYTMVGRDSDEGIMVRSLYDLFQLKEKAESFGNELKISMSYVEVYNETIRDLMVDKSEAIPLELYEDSSKNIIVNGVTDIVVKNSSEVFRLLT